jgi:hypothetical protein
MHECFIVDEVLQILKFVEFRDPALADFLHETNKSLAISIVRKEWHYLGNSIAQIRIAQHQPTARRDAIGFVLKFLWCQLVE